MTPPPGTIPVREGYEINTVALNQYLRNSIIEYDGPITEIFQFNNGQSNPTYYLKDSAGREFVLRKKPHGKLLPSAVSD